MIDPRNGSDRAAMVRTSAPEQLDGLDPSIGVPKAEMVLANKTHIGHDPQILARCLVTHNGIR
jgi:hypothetical protein